MCYCQSNILYKMVLSIILFAALCDLNPIMHSSKHTFCVAHYKWVQPISVLTFAIFFLHWHSVFSQFFPLAQTMAENMLQQTWYHGEEKSGFLSCHCPGCSSCHGTCSDQTNAKISICAVCDISAGQTTSGACCPQTCPVLKLQTCDNPFGGRSPGPLPKERAVQHFQMAKPEYSVQSERLGIEAVKTAPHRAQLLLLFT